MVGRLKLELGLGLGLGLVGMVRGRDWVTHYAYKSLHIDSKMVFVPVGGFIVFDFSDPLLTDLSPRKFSTI